MGMAMPMRGQPPPPTPRAFISDNESLSSISSPSDISDRELEYHLEDQKSRNVRSPLPAPPLNRLAGYIRDSDLEVERDPWNAVAVVGFRVYYKVDGNETKEGEEEETVKIKVIRPVWFPVEKDGETDKEKVLFEGKVKETGWMRVWCLTWTIVPRMPRYREVRRLRLRGVKISRKRLKRRKTEAMWLLRRRRMRNRKICW
jgi:hypothetical protein